MASLVRVALRYLLPLVMAPLAGAVALGSLALGTALALASATIFFVALPAVAGAHARRDGQTLRHRLFTLLVLPLLVVLIVAVIGPRRVARPDIGSARVAASPSEGGYRSTDEKIAFALLALAGLSFTTAWRLAGRARRVEY